MAQAEMLAAEAAQIRTGEDDAPQTGADEEREAGQEDPGKRASDQVKADKRGGEQKGAK